MCVAWDCEGVRQDFSAACSSTYLNTGTVGITPDPVVSRWLRELKEYNERGPGIPVSRLFRRDRLARGKAVMAAFVGADDNDVVFMPDTTAGLNAIVTSLDLSPGDEVIVSDIEHFAVRVPWNYVAQQIGLRVVVVPARNGQVYAEDVAAAITPRTRVLCLSHVSYMTGARLDVPALGRMARDHGIFFLVDGAQSIGCLNLKLSELECDAYAFPAYKWCLGPDGIGGLYVNPQARSALTPRSIASGATASMDVDGHFTLRDGSCMFAGSTLGLATVSGMHYALEYLQEIGMDRVESHVLQATGTVIDELKSRDGIEVISPSARDERSGLVTFRVDGLSGDVLSQAVDEAMETERLLIRSIDNLNAIRVSFHVFNTQDDAQHLLDWLDRVAP